MGHLQQKGFKVKANNISDNQLEAVKDKYGVPRSLRTCHTGIIDGYVIEGHVPADVVQRVLKEKPKIVGLAVPGMPIGSPGMSGPTPQPYDVYSFDSAGHVKIYQHINP